MPLEQRSNSAEEHGQEPEAEQDGFYRPAGGPERAGEHRPVDASHRVEPELDHHPREEHRYRSRRHGVRVGEPEVKRRDRRLHQEAGGDQREGHGGDRVRSCNGGHAPTELREVQRAGPPVEYRDAEQHQEGRHAVGDGEVESAEGGAPLLDL